MATYLVAAIALQSPGGKLGDRIGQWRAFGFGQALLAAGRDRGLPGADAVAADRVARADGRRRRDRRARHGRPFAHRTAAEHRRGRAFGIFGSVMSLAAGIGPLVGGELVRWFGWPSIFLANLPVSPCRPSLLRARTTTDSAPATRFDWWGSALLAGRLVCLVVGARGAGSPRCCLALAARPCCVPFVLVERRVADPVLAFGLFRDVRFTAGTLVIALLNLVMYALVFEIPLVVETPSSWAPADRPPADLPDARDGVDLPVAGRLTDRFGPRPLGLLGIFICLAGLVRCGSYRSTPPPTCGCRWPCSAWGRAGQPCGSGGLALRCRASDSGMAAGVGSTMRYLGGVVGIALLGRVIDGAASVDAVLAQHNLLLIIFVGVLIVAVGCAAFLGAGRHSTTNPARE